MRTLGDRPPARYVIPYVLTFVTTWALLALSRAQRPVELWTAVGLQVIVGLTIWTSHGEVGSRRFLLNAAALVVSVALIRDAIVLNPGVGVLAILPAVVAALRARGREMVCSLAFAAIALFFPEIVVGGAQYPASQLRGATLIVLVGAAIGSTVLALVRQLSAQQEAQRRLAEDANDQLKTQDALRRVATYVAAGAPPEELFTEVSEQLARIAGSSMGAVVRFDPDLEAGELVGRWRSDGLQTVDRHVDLSTGATAAAKVAATGKPVTFHTYAPGTAPHDAVASVAAPIYVKGRLWGSASAVFAHGERIPEGLGERFERFAELVAMAISNAEVVSELVAHASLDALTGIPNRRSFEEELARELERASRHQRPLSVVLLDIDRFKRVNDTYGHATGDTVLTEVAKVLMSQVRFEDMIARLGGEEFIWLMPDTGAEDAVIAAERARRAVASVDFGDVGPITLSAGVNSNRFSNLRADLLEGADRALYEAKHRGRDQTVAASASFSVADDRVRPAAA